MVLSQPEKHTSPVPLINDKTNKKIKIYYIWLYPIALFDCHVVGVARQQERVGTEFFVISSTKETFSPETFSFHELNQTFSVSQKTEVFFFSPINPLTTPRIYLLTLWRGPTPRLGTTGLSI